MTLRLEIKKLMLERSPRVKAIDFHPHNPWVVFALYSGTLALHDYSNNVSLSLPRPVSEPFKLQLSPSEPSSSSRKRTGSSAALMIFTSESSTTTQWKKSKLSKHTQTLSDPSSYIQLNPTSSPHPMMPKSRSGTTKKTSLLSELSTNINISSCPLPSTPRISPNSARHPWIKPSKYGISQPKEKPTSLSRVTKDQSIQSIFTKATNHIWPPAVTITQ